MSYEGYTQYLCKKGHTWSTDCMEDDSKVCPICGEKVVWLNMVDQTNGCERVGAKTEEERYDLTGLHKDPDDCICGHIDLEMKQIRCCDKCMSTLEVTYKIPKKGGRRL